MIASLSDNITTMTPATETLKEQQTYSVKIYIDCGTPVPYLAGASRWKRNHFYIRELAHDGEVWAAGTRARRYDYAFSTCISFRFSPPGTVMRFSFTQAGMRAHPPDLPVFLHGSAVPCTRILVSLISASTAAACKRLCVSSRTRPLGACALLSTGRVARWW